MFLISDMARASRESVAASSEFLGEAETYRFSGDIPRFAPRFTSYDIFLRELSSNAADALAILKDVARSDPQRLAAQQELVVYVTPDRENYTITVEDSGIGMKLQELTNYLGTVGRSGTGDYMEYRKVVDRSNPISFASGREVRHRVLFGFPSCGQGEGDQQELFGQ